MRLITFIFLFFALTTIYGCAGGIDKEQAEEIAIEDAEDFLGTQIELAIDISIREDYFDKLSVNLYKNTWKIRISTIKQEPLVMYYIDSKNGEILARSHF